MRSLLLATALILAIPKAGFAESLPDGTILFVEDSNIVVETVTDFQTTHVCIILDGKVYNAEPPVVRTYTVPEYLSILANSNGTNHQSKTVVCKPKTPLSQKDKELMREYLESQVGRRYSIRGYVRGVESDGIHCSQLTTEALRAIGRVRSERPWCVSPGGLRGSVGPLVNAKGYYFIERSDAPKKMAFRRVGDWLYDKSMFCSWSCWETWTFCQ